MEKKAIVFVLLMICQLVCCLSLSIITPFFPPYAISKGITEDVVGIIYSANPFGAIIGSLVVGKILNDVNYFNISGKQIPTNDFCANNPGLGIILICIYKLPG
jgi:MFS family permease